MKTISKTSAIVSMLLMSAGGVMAEPAAPHDWQDLSGLEKQFRATQQPLVFDYTVAYRFLHVEFSRLGNLVMKTTIGEWTASATSRPIPAVFIDLQFDSKDARGIAQRPRVSIHDRIVAVLAAPTMEALLFAKDTDEYLNPLLGRSRILRSVSCYDVQSGSLDYWQHNMTAGTVVTNVSDPQAIVEMSRKVRPILDFLMDQSHGNGAETLAPEALTLNVNTSGKVVPLRLRTVRDRAPGCLGGLRLTGLCVDAIPARKTDERLYRFHSWAVPFQELADRLKDAALQKASNEAFVKAVVPVVAEYEMVLGAIRMTLVAVRVETP